MLYSLSNNSKQYPPTQLYSSIRLALFQLTILGGVFISPELQANINKSAVGTTELNMPMPTLTNCHRINGGEVNCNEVSSVNNIRQFSKEQLAKTTKTDINYIENVNIEPVENIEKIPAKTLINEEDLENTLSEIERLEEAVQKKQKQLEDLNDELLNYQQPDNNQDYPLINSDYPQSEKKKQNLEEIEKTEKRKAIEEKIEVEPKKIQPTKDEKKNDSTDKQKSVVLTKQLIKKSYNPTANKDIKCQGQWVYPQIKNNYSDNPQTDSEGNPLTKDGFYALADYGYYDNKERAELSGNVIVKQGKQLINAEKVTLDLVNKIAKADGQVLFTDTATETNNNPNKKLANAGIVGIADEVVYDTTNATAEVSDIAFASTTMQAHGYAKKMKKVNDKKYQLKKVTFSTCPPKIVQNKPPKSRLLSKKRASVDISNIKNHENDEKIQRNWQLDASKINLDTNKGRAETYNTTLRIRDIPVLYLPYFNFPIDERRTSGFLSPSTSLSTTNGLEAEIAIPYYVNLAPNYDVTVTTKVFTNRNPMVLGEFRYLTKKYGKGQIDGSFLAKDKKYQDKNRSSVFYQHDWQSKKVPNLSINAQYNYVSDSEYKNDFDYLGVVDNELNLPRSIQTNYFNDYLDAELKFEDYQSLEATDINGQKIKDKDRPFKRLPQINVHYKLPKLGKNLNNHSNNPLYNNKLVKSALNNLEITGEHDSAYFKQSINDNSTVEKSGFRMYNSVNARYPIYNSWGKITPSVNLQHLYSTYDEDARLANNIEEKENRQSVFVPQFNLDTEISFVKQGSPFKFLQDNGGYQVLSPRLKYSYAPYKKQNDIPNFNTQIASLSYDQLFADSWFLGHDRLQDLHAVTPAINYRYIDKNGLTRLNASLAEQYYLDKGLVSLDDNSTSSTQSNRLFSKKSSGVVTSVSAQPYKNFWLDVDGALTTDHKLNYITSQFRYQPTDASQFSLGVMKRKENKNINQLPISAVTGSAIFPIKDKWRVLSQAQYDYDKNKFLDSLVGVDYEDCCLGFSIYGRHYYNNLQLDQKSNNAIMAELRLKGISSTGRLTKLLANKIVGFKNLSHYWNSKN
ncbi:MAG: LPS assembly protein LptD [Moraxellaceae bacterium]|nr:LPS assembly protein LptD [Moraxellaceae bacterium]